MRLFAFIVGLGFGSLGLWAVYPVLYPSSIPPGYYDLSAMPDEIEVKFYDPVFLERIALQEQALQKALAQIEAAAHLTQPDRVAPFPFGVIHTTGEDPLCYFIGQLDEDQEWNTETMQRVLNALATLHEN